MWARNMPIPFVDSGAEKSNRYQGLATTETGSLQLIEPPHSLYG
jgi:hypothetical protein